MELVLQAEPVVRVVVAQAEEVEEARPEVVQAVVLVQELAEAVAEAPVMLPPTGVALTAVTLFVPEVMMLTVQAVAAVQVAQVDRLGLQAVPAVPEH